MDEGLFDSKVVMVNFLNFVMVEFDIVKFFIMIDFLKWEVIEVGLKMVQGKCIVNFISFKEGEEEFICQVSLVCCYGVVVIVMVFDEVGQVDIIE